MEFESKLSSARVGNNVDKELSKIENIMKFFKLWEKVIKFYNDYFKMVHKDAYDENIEKDSKYQLQKKILQRFPIAAAQVKAANTFEKVLNEIRQIMHSLYQEKSIIKSYITI